MILKGQLVISGGDGNQWIRHAFDRLQIHQEFILDRFHLLRAARRAFGDWNAAKDCVSQLRQQGFDSVQLALSNLIQRSCGKSEQKLKEFYRYVRHNQDGLLNLECRGYSFPARLGASTFTTLPISAVDLDNLTLRQWPELGVHTKKWKKSNHISTEHS